MVAAVVTVLAVEVAVTLEVAVMSAVAAAHDIELEGRELAILCQKVENLVVGE